MPTSFHSAYSVAKRIQLEKYSEAISEENPAETSEDASSSAQQPEEDATEENSAGDTFILSINVSANFMLGFALFQTEPSEMVILERDILLSDDFYEVQLGKQVKNRVNCSFFG
jgi:hypothetical protein